MGSRAANGGMGPRKGSNPSLGVAIHSFNWVAVEKLKRKPLLQGNPIL